MKKYFLTAAFLVFSITAISQEIEKKEAKEEEGLRGTHRLTLAMGHAHLSQGIMENGKKGWKVIPSWGFDYDYWINNHWAIGLQNDMIIENFEVEDHENKIIERSRPFSSVASVIFKPKKHVSFIAGMGGEFSKEENLALTRLGIESGWEMKNNWEFGISFLYDIKWNAYNAWTISFNISKLLRKEKK
jgi:hypothetical protein